MTRRHRTLIVCWLLAGAALAHASLQPLPCDGCLRAHYWNIAPDTWGTGATADLPEMARLKKRRPVDLGIAFSGGGTRSATAALGQLRGLERNGWLTRVRYMAAVSGGAWAAVPFTFSKEAQPRLLGAFQRPSDLNYEEVTRRPNGSLAGVIARSSLASAGLREAIGQLVPAVVGDLFDQHQRQLTDLLKRLGGGARNQTYARLLGDKLIEPLVPTGSQRFFAWDSETVGEITALNPGLDYGDFLTTDSRSRPFLVVGASMVSARPDYDYPRLIPVEYTPLYTGVRQRYGGRIGGTYVWSWAYGSSSLSQAAGGTVEVRRGAGDARLTLADVAASTGAAPQLLLLLGGPVPRAAAAARAAAGVFPSFRHGAVRDGRSNIEGVILPHGDGGFTDNLGLMPLLVRQVRNIIVFVNAKSEFDENRDVESFFRPVLDRGPTGDKSMNHVFDEARYHDLLAGFRERLGRGQALVYCGRNWRVTGNEFYNLSGYDGVNICWVYNHAASAWEHELPESVRALLKETGTRDKLGSFANFPWYETFGQNAPNVIRLTTAQVNMLASLAAWSITNDESVRLITEGLDVLDRPAR